MKHFLTVAALTAALIVPVPGMAQQQADLQPRIVVTGEGEAAVRPDMAIVSLAVMREAETARAALDANNAAMRAVIEALKESGIADRDLQTSGLSIQPRWDYERDNEGNQTARLAAYQVSNALTVRVRDLSMVGAVIDSSVTLGVNQGGSISFTNADPDAVIDQARRDAVENATRKARTLADAANVGLGAVIEITEQSNQPMPVPLGARAMRMEAEAVPVEAGENAYSVSVTMTFLLEQ
ncbi:MAG: SIMPL domain-containing protein [Rhizobiaceae bacterium]|nr:SIMPL domain-containing protein [Rhizobiaceae bacterium]